MIAWWAAIATSVLVGPSVPYTSVHGPFPSRAACVQFVQTFVKTYDPQASGATIKSAICVHPGKNVVVVKR